MLLSGEAALAALAVIDDSGKGVTLAKPAKRIVSLSPAATELLFAAGGGAHVVGTVEFSDYPPAAAALPRVGNSATLNIEAIAALAPDLIIAWPHGAAQRQMAQLLRLKVPLFVSDPRSLADIASGLETFGRLTDSQSVATAAARQYRSGIEALRQANSGAAPVRVFLQIWNAPVMTVNDRNLIADALRLCGGRNIFGDAHALAPTVGYEAVVAANPQAIVAIAEPATARIWLKAWERWPSLDAVRYGSRFDLSGQTISVPTPRVLAGVNAMCVRLDQTRRRRS
jgi:iron complex transport system substrate-binding protein